LCVLGPFASLVDHSDIGCHVTDIDVCCSIDTLLHASVSTLGQRHRITATTTTTTITTTTTTTTTAAAADAAYSDNDELTLAHAENPTTQCGASTVV